MDWRIVSLIAFVMWGGYAVLGSVASRAHGENVNISLEAAAMLLVAVVAISRVGLSEFGKATPVSLTQGSIMGLLSAGGLMLQFYAFRIAPVDKQGAVVMITCMFPVLAIIIFHILGIMSITGGAIATTRQWFGVACGVLALWLISK